MLVVGLMNRERIVGEGHGLAERRSGALSDSVARPRLMTATPRCR